VAPVGEDQRLVPNSAASRLACFDSFFRPGLGQPVREVGQRLREAGFVGGGVRLGQPPGGSRRRSCLRFTPALSRRRRRGRAIPRQLRPHRPGLVADRLLRPRAAPGGSAAAPQLKFASRRAPCPAPPVTRADLWPPGPCRRRYRHLPDRPDRHRGPVVAGRRPGPVRRRPPHAARPDDSPGMIRGNNPIVTPHRRFTGPRVRADPGRGPHPRSAPGHPRSGAAEQPEGKQPPLTAGSPVTSVLGRGLLKRRRRGGPTRRGGRTPSGSPLPSSLPGKVVHMMCTAKRSCWQRFRQSVHPAIPQRSAGRRDTVG